MFNTSYSGAFNNYGQYSSKGNIFPEIPKPPKPPKPPKRTSTDFKTQGSKPNTENESKTSYIPSENLKRDLMSGKVKMAKPGLFAKGTLSKQIEACGGKENVENVFVSQDRTKGIARFKNGAYVEFGIEFDQSSGTYRLHKKKDSGDNKQKVEFQQNANKPAWKIPKSRYNSENQSNGSQGNSTYSYGQSGTNNFAGSYDYSNGRSGYPYGNGYPSPPNMNGVGGGYGQQGANNFAGSYGYNGPKTGYPYGNGSPSPPNMNGAGVYGQSGTNNFAGSYDYSNGYANNGSMPKDQYHQEYSSTNNYNAYENKANQSYNTASGSNGVNPEDDATKNNYDQDARDKSPQVFNNAKSTFNSLCQKYLNTTVDFSDENAIKKAYRKLAIKLHPDKGGNQEELKSLNEAKDIIYKNLEK